MRKELAGLVSAVLLVPSCSFVKDEPQNKQTQERTTIIKLDAYCDERIGIEGIVQFYNRDSQILPAEPGRPSLITTSDPWDLLEWRLYKEKDEEIDEKTDETYYQWKRTQPNKKVILYFQEPVEVRNPQAPQNFVDLKGTFCFETEKEGYRHFSNKKAEWDEKKIKYDETEIYPEEVKEPVVAEPFKTK